MSCKETLKKIFCEILELEDCEENVSFMELGGDSYKFTLLQMQIKREFGKKISLKDLYRNSSIEKLTSLLNQNSSTITEESYVTTDMLKTVYVGRKDGVVMGGQGSKVYFELECDNYDSSRFKNAVEKLTNKQMFLRAAFSDETKFTVKSELKTEIEEIDLRGLSDEEIKTSLEETRERQYEVRFDASKAPLIVFVVSILTNKAIIHITYDGVVSDGEGLDILIRELDRIYGGAEAAEICNFADYQAYLSELKTSEEYVEDEKYWEELINKTSHRPYIPILMRPEKVVNTGAKQIIRKFKDEQYEILTTIAKKNQITPFSLLLTVFSKVLSLYSKNQAFFLNVPMSIRTSEVMNLNNTVGQFSNFSFIPVDDSANLSIADMSHNIQETLLDCREHSSFLGTDVLKLFQKRIGASIPAPITFTSTIGSNKESLSNFKKTFVRTYTTQNWIEVLLTELTDEKVFLMSYEHNLISESIANGIADCFMNTIEALVQDEDNINNINSIFVSQKDFDIISSNALFDNGDASYDGPSISEILKTNMELYKDDVAIASMEECITYGDLKIQTENFLSALIQKVGRKPARIALLMDKSPKQIVVSIACMCAGISYMPLETELPKEVWNKCIANINAEAVVVLGDYMADVEGENYKVLNIADIVFDKDIEGSNFIDDLDIDSEVVIINTSGTTGTPKSSSINGRALVNCICNAYKQFNIDFKVNSIAATSICHDLSLFDIYTALCNGGSVVVPSELMKKEPAHLYNLIVDYDVNLWNSVPAFMEMLTLLDKARASEALSKLKIVILGGDWVSPALVSKIKSLSESTEVYSIGGPTETTVMNIYHKVNESDLSNDYIPYGKPFPNTSYYILNKNKALCPIGVPGVMCVSGVSLSNGYIGNDEETKAKFIEHDGRRVYYTGDRGMYLPNGEIRILGRDDYQVKINGKRIELTGIENFLKAYEGIVSCIVFKDEATDKLVAAYKADSVIDENKIKAFLSNSLQDYMIPHKYMKLDEFPVTRNGKIDRKKIAQIMAEGNIENKEENSKKEEIVESTLDRIVNVCKEIFDDDDITAEDDFYGIGGDSISAMKLAAWIYETYHVEIQVFEILNNPEMEEIANLVDEARENEE